MIQIDPLTSTTDIMAKAKELLNDTNPITKLYVLYKVLNKLSVKVDRSKPASYQIVKGKTATATLIQLLHDLS